MAQYQTMKRVRSGSDSGSLALAAFGGCVLSALLVAYSVLTSGWVLTVYWDWFIQPTFHLPAISLPVAVGIGAVARLLTYTDTSNLQTKESDIGDKWGRVVGNLLSPWVVLFFGWIVHLSV